MCLRHLILFRDCYRIQYWSIYECLACGSNVSAFLWLFCCLFNLDAFLCPHFTHGSIHMVLNALSPVGDKVTIGRLVSWIQYRRQNKKTWRWLLRLTDIVMTFFHFDLVITMYNPTSKLHKLSNRSVPILKTESLSVVARGPGD